MSAVVGIFAHPDDEAFGPGGTLATLAKEHDVYLICVTNGDAGINSSKKTQELGEIRREELLFSSQIVGVKKVFFLNYKDGSLSHNLYHEIADKIKTLIDDIRPDVLLTYEPRGVSGHIDHITTSMIASYLFQKVKYVKELWYFCVTEAFRDTVRNYFIYWPPGYAKKEITKVVDVTDVWEQKIAAIKKHESQKHDVERNLVRFEHLPKEENFIIVKK
jgi:N-acetylglucosamine malate deacetylase 2